MDNLRAEIFGKIETKRKKYLTSFGSELDGLKTPNDWASTITYYVTEHITKNNVPASKEDFEDALLNAGSVLVAALEHIDRMVENGTLTK